MARWRQIFDEEEAAALGSGCSNDQAYDHGQVAAWLDSIARSRRLRVQRYFPDSGRIARHRVEILLENEEGGTASVTVWASSMLGSGNDCNRGKVGRTGESG